MKYSIKKYQNELYLINADAVRRSYFKPQNPVVIYFNWILIAIKWSARAWPLRLPDAAVLITSLALADVKDKHICYTFSTLFVDLLFRIYIVTVRILSVLGRTFSFHNFRFFSWRLKSVREIHIRFIKC